MSKYVNAADAAEKIAEKHGIRIADLCDTFGDIPAADVTPVVHGRWIGIDSSFWKPTHSSDIPVFRKTYRCSECRRRTAIAENYCPNCGEKMDKEETNELDKREG